MSKAKALLILGVGLAALITSWWINRQAQRTLVEVQAVMDRNEKLYTEIQRSLNDYKSLSSSDQPCITERRISRHL